MCREEKTAPLGEGVRFKRRLAERSWPQGNIALNERRVTHCEESWPSGTPCTVRESRGMKGCGNEGCPNFFHPKLRSPEPFNAHSFLSPSLKTPSFPPQPGHGRWQALPRSIRRSTKLTLADQSPTERKNLLWKGLRCAVHTRACFPRPFPETATPRARG